MSTQSSSFLRQFSAMPAIFLFAGTALLMLASPLRADTLVNYNVSGSVPSAIYQYDGVTPIAASTLSGTVQVDQTTASISADLFLTGGISGEYSYSSPISSSTDYSYPNLVDLFAYDPSASPASSDPADAFPFLVLVLSGNPMTAPGALQIVTSANASQYEDSTNVGYYSVSNVGQGEGQFIDLTSGSLTPAGASPVPEPGSLALFSTGLAALGAGLHRLRRS